ncbi:MAG: von Willebrand factor type A domain-containing protein [Bacteroidales bacterium]|nr:von Willebrand factor type A domain-containing protein [Bacteroidales bacterium]
MNKLSYFAMAAICGFAFASCSGDDDCDSAAPMGYYENDAYNSPMEALADDSGAEQPTGDQFTDFSDNPFIKCDKESTSTFSVDADGASYAIMRKYANKGWEISPKSVRIEEFLNYFTYDYAEPTDNHTVAISTEIADCPWNPEHKLLRLGIKGKSLSQDQLPKSNYVFLVDVSGSMLDEDKLPLLKSGLKTLVAHLEPEDRISLITYSGRVSKELESTPAKEIDKINSAINRLSAEGSTNGGQALIDAYKEALANYVEGGNNRVILGTDGDFNVGITSTEDLLKVVEEYADKGIFTTVCGFGSGNLNDGMMEAVSNRGNGTYEYIDCENQMMKVFVHERSKLISVACDSKCQVKFNPAVVESYRLIGYENRVMNNEDFDNDAKDAGEIGSGQTITALYEIVLAEETTENANETKIATFDFRYKKQLGDQSYLLSLDVQKSDVKAEPSGEFSFAAGVAAYGMILRNSPYKGNATIALAKELASKGLTFDELKLRDEFVRIMDKAKPLAK